MRIWLPLLALLLATPSLAQAQNRRLDIERLRPTSDRNGYLGIPSTSTPGEWAWDVALWGNYSLEPLTLRRLDTDETVPVVGHRVGMDLLMQLGILDRIAVGLDIPAIVYQDANPAPLDAGPEIASGALRDPFVSVRVRLLGAGATADHARVEGEGLAVQVGMTMPFGLEDSFAGEGNPQLEGRVIGDFRFLDFAVGAELGYRHRFAEPRVLGVQFANELFFGAAIQSPTFFVQNLSAIVEVRVVTALDQEAFMEASTAVEGDLGVRWAEGDLALTWAVGTGFNGGVGTPGFRGIFGLEFAPRTHDVDEDGIEDDRDGCPRLPEDVDEFQDDDGCPDLDNDEDLIPDTDDRCPMDAADFERDEDEDGCTDPVTDVDEDGIEDDEDACPEEPEDADGHQDEDGCPDDDNDEDTIADADDACPDEPEDVDEFEDADGCPDLDDDGDGVPDTDDACPRVAEDVDEHEDEDGCPDPDDDHDGVLDADDQCPEEAETINGVDDDDGCPDTGGRARWIASGDADSPSLRGRIRFAADGSIRAISDGSLDQLARHLIARSGSRWRITIPASEAPRAEALTAALAERGVPEATFEILNDADLSAGTATVTPAPTTP